MPEINLLIAHYILMTVYDEKFYELARGIF